MAKYDLCHPYLRLKNLHTACNSHDNGVHRFIKKLKWDANQLDKIFKATLPCLFMDVVLAVEEAPERLEFLKNTVNSFQCFMPRWIGNSTAIFIMCRPHHLRAVLRAFENDPITIRFLTYDDHKEAIMSVETIKEEYTRSVFHKHGRVMVFYPGLTRQAPPTKDEIKRLFSRDFEQNMPGGEEFFLFKNDA